MSAFVSLADERVNSYQFANTITTTTLHDSVASRVLAQKSRRLTTVTDERPCLRGHCEGVAVRVMVSIFAPIDHYHQLGQCTCHLPTVGQEAASKGH